MKFLSILIGLVSIVLSPDCLSQSDKQENESILQKIERERIAVCRKAITSIATLQNKTLGVFVDDDGTLLTGYLAGRKLNDTVDVGYNGSVFAGKLVSNLDEFGISVIRVPVKSTPIEISNMRPEVGSWAISFRNVTEADAALYSDVAGHTVAVFGTVNGVRDYCSNPLSPYGGFLTDDDSSLGSPIVNSDGKMIGMHCGRITDKSTGYSFDTTTGTILAKELYLQAEGTTYNRGSVMIPAGQEERETAPCDTSAETIRRLISCGFKRGKIGILTENSAKGLKVTSVYEGYPAKSVIFVGDIIVSITDAEGKEGKLHPIKTLPDLMRVVSFSAGKKLTFDVRRESKSIVIELTPADDSEVEKKAAERADRARAASGEIEKIGIDVVDLTPELATFLGIGNEKGVVVKGISKSSDVRSKVVQTLATLVGKEKGVPSSESDQPDLRKGDVIIATNNKAIADTAALKTALAEIKQGDYVVLTVVRDRVETPVVVKIR